MNNLHSKNTQYIVKIIVYFVNIQIVVIIVI